MNLLVGIGTWIKSHIVISIIVGIVIAGGVIITPIIINNIQDNKTKQEEKNKTNIILVDNLNLEIFSEIKLYSLINSINNGKIISEDEIIDTSILGEKELSIKYLNEKEELKTYNSKINIIDTTKPNIEYTRKLTTTVGTKIDLLKDVKVTDNSKEEISVVIDGDYDINKTGTYNLKYVAVDSSNNKTEEEFTLIVNNDPYEKYYGKYDNLELKKNGAWSSEYGMCEGYVKISGTYSINGNILKLKRTSPSIEYVTSFITMELIIGNNILTVKSWEYYKDKNNNWGCTNGCYFDCSYTSILKKR